MTEEERKEFGAYLRRLRDAAKLSLREAEREVGISNSYLYQIERGERGAPKLDVLRKMAVAYGVSFKSLLAAAHLDEPDENAQFYDAELLEDELERAFDFVRTDKGFRFGTHMNSSSLTPDAKRFIVEMYQKLKGLKLLSDQGETDGPADK